MRNNRFRLPRHMLRMRPPCRLEFSAQGVAHVIDAWGNAPLSIAERIALVILAACAHTTRAHPDTWRYAHPQALWHVLGRAYPGNRKRQHQTMRTVLAILERRGWIRYDEAGRVVVQSGIARQSDTAMTVAPDESAHLGMMTPPGSGVQHRAGGVLQVAHAWGHGLLTEPELLGLLVIAVHAPTGVDVTAPWCFGQDDQALYRILAATIPGTSEQRHKMVLCVLRNLWRAGAIRRDGGGRWFVNPSGPYSRTPGKYRAMRRADTAARQAGTTATGGDQEQARNAAALIVDMLNAYAPQCGKPRVRLTHDLLSLAESYGLRRDDAGRWAGVPRSDAEPVTLPRGTGKASAEPPATPTACRAVTDGAGTPRHRTR